jgi:hypothetical protein
MHEARETSKTDTHGKDCQKIYEILPARPKWLKSMTKRVATHITGEFHRDGQKNSFHIRAAPLGVNAARRVAAAEHRLRVEQR